MTATEVGYEQVRAWGKARVKQTQATVVQTIGWAVLWVLVAQRVTPAALARALPAEHAGSGRARLTRVRRWWTGAVVEQAVVSPPLITGGLAWLSPGPAVVVALATTRLGRWAGWLAGLVVAGRTRPSGWAAIPSPWPNGRLRCTTLTLLQRWPAAFPVGVRGRLVADRGFPSAALCAQLRQGETDFSVRLRLSDWVTVAGGSAKVADHLVSGRLRHGQRTAATIGRGQADQPLVPGWVVVSATIAAVPQHQRNLGTLRARAKRAKAQRQHRLHQQGRKTTPPSATAPRYAQTWVLFTTAPTVRQAVREYAQRLPIAETFRDWPTGWGVRAALSKLPTEPMVERLLGVVCLAYSLQMPLGQRLSADPVARHRRVQSTVTDRVSWFWCGQRLFAAPGYDWYAWLAAQWAMVTTLPAPPLPNPLFTPMLAEAA